MIVEAEAADWYEFDQDVTTQRVGFITDDGRTMGCSPDRFVGDDGLLEIKTPLPHTSPNEAGSTLSAGMTCCQNS